MLHVEDPEYQKMLEDLNRLKRLRAAMIESDRLSKMMPGDYIIQQESKDLMKFVEHAWHILEPPTREFKKGWAIDAIALHLTKVTEGKIRHLLINVPPGFMKSLLTKVFWPAWEWGPMGMTYNRFVTASYAQSLSTRDARKLKRLITSEWYQRLWPHVKLAKDQAQKANFHNTKTGFMLGTSVGGLGTGERGDRFICFPYDQNVATERGFMKIGDIVESKLDVKVWSTDVYTGKTELKPIIGWYKNPSSRIIEVTFSDGARIRCTPCHKVWTKNGWIEAQNLKSSDRLPNFPDFYPFDNVPVNIVPSTERMNAIGGFKYFQNIFICKFRMSTLFARPHIRIFSKSNSNILPKRTTSYLADCMRGNTINISKDFGGLCSLNNFNNLLFGKFCAWPILIQRECTVFLGISNIFRACAVSKIGKMVIERVSIKMSDLHIFRAGPNKGQHNNSMDKNMGFARSISHIKAKIATIVRRFKDFPLNKIWLTSPVTHSGFASNSTHITDTISFLPSWDRQPLFIREVDHADNTFCLNVENNHTFFCGKDKDMILVSNCDDANNVREAESTKVRTETNLWRSETVPTRINDPETSAFIDIQQRVHDMDASGFLLHKDNRTKDLVHLCIPMEFEVANRCVTPYWKDPRKYEGELAWPERFDAKEVARLKKALKSYAASAQLQQRPTIRGGGIIKTKDWKLWKEAAFPPMEFIIGSFDGAYTEDEANDPSAFTIWGVWRDPITRVVNVMLMYGWEAYLELNEAVEKLRKDCKLYQVDKLLIENKATGKSVSQELKRRFRGVVSTELVDPKGDKVSRTFTVQHMFEDGMVYAPIRIWAQTVIDQVASMSPAGCTAPHDDLVDTVTQALGWLRRNGFALLKEEGTGETEFFGKELQNSTEPIYDV